MHPAERELLDILQIQILEGRARQIQARAFGDDVALIVVTGAMDRALDRWSTFAHRNTLTG